MNTPRPSPDFYVVASTSFTGCAGHGDRDITGLDPVPSIVLAGALPGARQPRGARRYARKWGRRLQPGLTRVTASRHAGMLSYNSECNGVVLQLGASMSSRAHIHLLQGLL